MDPTQAIPYRFKGITGTPWRVAPLPECSRQVLHICTVQIQGHHGYTMACCPYASVQQTGASYLYSSQGKSWAPSYEGTKGRLQYLLRPQKYTPR